MIPNCLSKICWSQNFNRFKFFLAVFGWPAAFLFWFLIICLLYVAPGQISQFQLYIFIFLWLVIVCSFFSAILKPPESCREVNREYLNKEELEKWDGAFCEACDYVKPKRWHHCRKCNRCVHRMDHHCPILQICVHRKNHKYFLLFLIWPLLLAIFAVYHGSNELWALLVAACSLKELPTDEHVKGTGISNAFMVGVAAIYLLYYQLPNLLRNQTLIEEAREETRFDLGNWWKNVEYVMGNRWIAFLPIVPDFDELETID